MLVTTLHVVSADVWKIDGPISPRHRPGTKQFNRLTRRNEAMRNIIWGLGLAALCGACEVDQPSSPAKNNVPDAHANGGSGGAATTTSGAGGTSAGTTGGSAGASAAGSGGTDSADAAS